MRSGGFFWYHFVFSWNWKYLIFSNPISYPLMMMNWLAEYQFKYGVPTKFNSIATNPNRIWTICVGNTCTFSYPISSWLVVGRLGRFIIILVNWTHLIAFTWLFIESKRMPLANANIWQHSWEHQWRIANTRRVSKYTIFNSRWHRSNGNLSHNSSFLLLSFDLQQRNQRWAQSKRIFFFLSLCSAHSPWIHKQTCAKPLNRHIMPSDTNAKIRRICLAFVSKIITVITDRGAFKFPCHRAIVRQRTVLDVSIHK